MYKAGKSLWIVRNLTDAYCGTKGFLPWKGGHNQGTDETVDWIRDNLNALDDTSNKVMGGRGIGSSATFALRAKRRIISST